MKKYILYLILITGIFTGCSQSKYPPHSVLCDNKGNYTWTDKYGNTRFLCPSKEVAESMLSLEQGPSKERYDELLDKLEEVKKIKWYVSEK